MQTPVGLARPSAPTKSARNDSAECSGPCDGVCSVSGNVCRANVEEFGCGGVDACVAEACKNIRIVDFAAGFNISMSSDQFEDTAPRCSISGELCSDDSECQSHDLCENLMCSISGGGCSRDNDCDSGGDDICVGACSLGGNPCTSHPVSGLRGEPSLQCAGLDVCVDTSQEVALDLDLDAAGGSGGSVFFEGFESNDLGSFRPMNLDAGRSNLDDADGYRCQYSDPDNPSSNSFGRDVCVMGSPAQADAFQQ